MFEIKVTITAPELSGAIEKLAEAVAAQPQATTKKKTKAAQPEPQLMAQTMPSATVSQQTVTPAVPPSAPAPVAPSIVQATQQPATPVSMSQPIPTVAPAQVVPSMAPNPAPTTAVQYDLDTLQRAAAPFADAGRSSEVISLLSQFGVRAITDLRPEQYGYFATALRSMGAMI